MNKLKKFALTGVAASAVVLFASGCKEKTSFSPPVPADTTATTTTAASNPPGNASNSAPLTLVGLNSNPPAAPAAAAALPDMNSNRSITLGEYRDLCGQISNVSLQFGDLSAQMSNVTAEVKHFRVSDASASNDIKLQWAAITSAVNDFTRKDAALEVEMEHLRAEMKPPTNVAVPPTNAAVYPKSVAPAARVVKPKRGDPAYQIAFSNVLHTAGYSPLAESAAGKYYTNCCEARGRLGLSNMMVNLAADVGLAVPASSLLGHSNYPARINLLCYRAYQEHGVFSAIGRKFEFYRLDDFAGLGVLSSNRLALVDQGKKIQSFLDGLRVTIYPAGLTNSALASTNASGAVSAPGIEALK